MDKRRLRIRELMERLEMSYRQLAERTGIPSSVLQRYVTNNTNKMSIDYFEQIANALGVSPLYLMGWTDDEHYTIDKTALPKDVYTYAEQTHIKKYRSLSPNGQKTVDNMLDNLVALEDSMSEKEKILPEQSSDGKAM